MSTRSTINFTESYGGKTTIVAKIYRHSDGYPGKANGSEYGVLPDLREFFDDVKRHTADTRFGDAAYLAAKFVVWQARKNARSNLRWTHSPAFHERTDAELDALFPEHFLDFLSLGILTTDPDDIAYTYFIDCSATDGKGYPKVRWSRAGAKRRTPVVYPVRPHEGAKV